MKKWTIFSLLKMAELGVLLFVVHLLSIFGNYINVEVLHELPMIYIANVAIGFCFAILFFIVVGVTCVGAWQVIKKNIEWADKLSK